MRNIRSLIIVAIFSLLVPAMGIARNKSSFPESTPEKEGVSSTAILAWVDAVEEQIDAMHSFMIIRHGKQIASGWWDPFSPDTPHVMHSLSKSFTSTAVGIAVDEGLLSMDDRVISFFPEEAPEEPSANLKEMRVKDLLTMNTGQREEPRVTDDEENWVQVFLGEEVDFKPGTHFKYNSMATYMLSAIIQKVSGHKLVDYLTPRLFEPLGIEKPRWEVSPEGINTGGWGLYITTEDIARLGQLYLQKGVWNGKQILSEEWVEMATARQVSTGSNPESDWEQGYGFQFWRSRHNSYRGDGAFGQFCLVLPEKDAVIAITSASENMWQVMQLVWDILLPAMEDEELPENPAALAKLEQKTSNLTVKPLEGEITSPVVNKISGKKYVFPENEQGIRSVYFDLKNTNPRIRVEMKEGNAIIPVGSGEYIRAESNRLLPYTGNIPGIIAGSGAWARDNEFRIRIYFPTSTGRLNYTLRFDEDELIWETVPEFILFAPLDTVNIKGKLEE